MNKFSHPVLVEVLSMFFLIDVYEIEINTIIYL